MVQEYDGQGWHRTGTDVDLRSAEWLAAQVKDHGLEATLQPVELDRVDIQASHVEIDGRRVEGLPIFDGGFTGPDGVVGTLGPLGSDAEVGLARVQTMSTSEEYLEARRSGQHRALVAVTFGGEAGLAPLNAPEFEAGFGLPVVQVGSEAWEWLSEHAQKRSEVCLIDHVKRTPVEAFNVIATARGKDSSLPPLAVMTPRSGWWNCAAERGGGHCLLARGDPRPGSDACESGHGARGHHGP